MKLLLSSNFAILHIRIESSNNRRIYTGQSYYEIESPFEQQMEMKDPNAVPYFAVFSLNFTQFELSLIGIINQVPFHTMILRKYHFLPMYYVMSDRCFRFE